MSIVKNISILIVACLLGYGCYDDKSSYGHEQIDEVRIDTAGCNAQANYSVSRFDTLEITPKVYYKGERVNPQSPQFPELEFTWEMYQQGGNNPIVPGDTLSREVELKVPLKLSEITWELLYTVYNKQTDVKEFMKFSVKINASLTEGWMVLYEKDGKTDVGLIANKLIAPNVTKEYSITDIYGLSNHGALNGKPVRLFYSMASTPHSIFVVSDQDMARVDPITFASTAGFEDLFWTTPGTKAPAFMTAFSTRAELAINNNKVQYCSYMMMGANRANTFLGDPCLGTYGELAPWAATSISYSYAGVVYDQTNKGFRRIASNGSEVTAFPAQSADLAFNCNSVGLTFVMGDFGRNKYEYAVMKGDASDYHLVVSNFTGDADKIGVAKYAMNNCPEIANITSFTTGYKGEVAYYSAGSELYLYDYKSANRAVSVWTEPNGDPITCVRLQKYYYGEASNKPVNDCEVIYVASYNETSKKGTVYQMKVDPSNGAVDEASVKPYYNFGRVQDMGWKKQ